MLRPNREKICMAVAALIFVLGVYSMLNTQAVRYPDVQIKLVPDDQEVPPVEPALYVGALGGNRNPFQLSSQWKPMDPEALDLPPPEPEQQVRILFGWVADRAPGAPIHYRSGPLHEAAGDDGGGAEADGDGGGAQ